MAQGFRRRGSGAEPRFGVALRSDATYTVVPKAGTTPSPQPAIQFATRVARVVGAGVQVTLLHVGDPENVPDVTLPEESRIEWTTVVLSGDAPAQIVAEADRLSANLIVMTTDGRDVLMDALRGSHTERVVRGAPCPVVAIPIPKE